MPHNITKSLERLREELRKEDRTLQEGIDYIKKHIDKLWEFTTTAESRLQDLEVHVNVLTRLLTSICIDYLGIPIRKLRRLIKQVEKDTIADTQIVHLEKLFRLEPKPKRSNHGRANPA